MFHISKKVQRAYNERDQFASMALRAERERSYAISQRDEAVELLSKLLNTQLSAKTERGMPFMGICPFCGEITIIPADINNLSMSESISTAEMNHKPDCPVTQACALIERIEKGK